MAMRRWLILLALGILVGVACSGGGVTSTPTTGADRLTATAARPGSSTFNDLLRLVPDSPGTRSYLSINDYRLVREQFNIPVPGKDADSAQVLEYMRALSGQGPDNTPLFRLADSMQHWTLGVESGETAEFHNYFGFDIRDVDQSVYTGRPPSTFRILRGSFDPKATAAALKACTVCEQPVLGEYSGMSFYSWGEDFQQDYTKILAPPAYDNLGRGCRIVVSEELALRTLDTPGMKVLIDTQKGAFPSLASVEEYALMARGMSKLGAYSVIFTDWTPGLTDTLANIKDEAIKTEVTQSPLLRPFQALATGAGKDERGLYNAVVLVHPDNKTAAENVQLLQRRVKETSSIRYRRPWQEMTGYVEVRSDGRLLEAKLYGTPFALNVGNLFYSRDLDLFLHE
ncbi:MAG: hypothetical protein Q8O40_03020 [Chloroflexota bacterium]|nr:hypothetical protein [Chloroflexota bacterium]